MTEGQLQIGVVADRLGLSIRTLRHWEEVGLVTPSARTAGGFRLYTEADLDRLMTIRRMKPLGFTLEKMRDLLRSLDTLTADDATPTDRAEARQFRTDCSDRVATSQQTLQQRLVWAGEFSNLLAVKISSAS